MWFIDITVLQLDKWFQFQDVITSDPPFID